jgi:hypothetical protein
VHNQRVKNLKKNGIWRQNVKKLRKKRNRENRTFLKREQKYSDKRAEYLDKMTEYWDKMAT